MRAATVVCRTSQVIYLSAGQDGPVALHESIVPSCPFSLIVDAPLAMLELEPGERVEMGEGYIASRHGRVAARPPASRPPRCAGPPLASMRELVRFVPKLLRRVPQLHPVLDPLERWAAGEVSTSWTVERVLGWGEGLTPSGDDALVGFLAAHAVTRDGDGVRDLSELRSEIVDAAPGRTTFVSAALLAHAVAGRFSQPIEGLRGAHSSRAVARRANRLARVGATSGLDTLAGIWLAARTANGCVAAGDTLSSMARRGLT
jgi:hypothetical protein